MIYLFTAMYCEAYPLIRKYQLKKETSQTHFQVFFSQSQDICLVITGTGMIAAAAAVGSVCTKYPPKDHDFLVNIGICAGISNRKELFLCSKITEQITGKTFYPDILYRHPFFEAEVITGAKPFQKEELKKSRATCLYDMEASAIYQSGSYFFGPHQMYFLKTISDSGSFEHITPQQVQFQISSCIDIIVLFLNQLYKIREMQTNNETLSDRAGKTKHQQSDRKNSTPTAGNIADTLCQDLHCSRVMELSLRQHIRYCILSGMDYTTVINDMYKEQKLPCKDKREGKLRFEELRKRLL